MLIQNHKTGAVFTVLAHNEHFGLIIGWVKEPRAHVLQMVVPICILSLLEVNQVKAFVIAVCAGEHQNCVVFVESQTRDTLARRLQTGQFFQAVCADDVNVLVISNDKQVATVGKLEHFGILELFKGMELSQGCFLHCTLMHDMVKLGVVEKTNSEQVSTGVQGSAL